MKSQRGWNRMGRACLLVCLLACRTAWADGHGSTADEPPFKAGNARPLSENHVAPKPPERVFKAGSVPANAHGQPQGALSGVVVFCSPGHGFTYENQSWITQRPFINDMVEDMGNLDQVNLFASYCFNAGATVVPMRPVGHQTNEVVLDNESNGVVFNGPWLNSANAPFYGPANAAVRYRYAGANPNGETATARYVPDLPAAGFYPVYVWASHGSDRVRQLYRIHHSGGISEIRVDHGRVGNGWVWIGTYHFERGRNGHVEISNHAPGAAPNQVVIADAVRFGNGMGDVDRGRGVSGFERELEASFYWILRSGGNGMPNSVPGTQATDRGSNHGAPVRMSAYMHREGPDTFWNAIYLGFHSNAGGGRGTEAVVHPHNPAGYLAFQSAFGTALSGELHRDMRSQRNGVEFQENWLAAHPRAHFQGAYAEVSHANVNGEMVLGLIEVAFHDNPDDANVLKDPAARTVAARACYKAVVQFLHAHNPAVPLSLLPEPPRQVRAVNSAPGRARISWQAPAANPAGGQAPTGYVVYRSGNGHGFGHPVRVAANPLSVEVNGLVAGRTYYFRVAAVNAGGESFPTETVGIVAAADGLGDYLVVNAYDRYDRHIPPTRRFAHNLNGDVAMVRPRQINSFDYVVQHLDALAAAGVTADSCANEAVADGTIPLRDYQAVVWAAGRESTVDQVFSPDECQRVRTYLERDGGQLFLSGSEIGYALDSRGSADERDFFRNVLRCGFVRDSAGVFAAAGVAGSLFETIGQLRFDDGTGPAYRVAYPDVLSAGNGARACLQYGNPVAAVQFEGNWKTVAMGFPFETIVDAASRNALMAGVARFFAVPGLPLALVDGTRHSPAAPTPDSDVVVSTRSSPAGAAVRTTVQFSVDNGPWQSRPMVAAGAEGNFDLWSAGLGRFALDSVVRYRVEAVDAAGHVRRDDNAGAFYSFTVKKPTCLALSIVPFAVAGKTASVDPGAYEKGLKSLYAIRDMASKSKTGAAYVDQYYRYSPAVLSLVVSDADPAGQAALCMVLIDKVARAAAEFLAHGDSKASPLSPSEWNDARTLLQRCLKSTKDPALQDLLADLLANTHKAESKTFAELWTLIP